MRQPNAQLISTIANDVEIPAWEVDMTNISNCVDRVGEILFAISTKNAMANPKYEIYLIQQPYFLRSLRLNIILPTLPHWSISFPHCLRAVYWHKVSQREFKCSRKSGIKQNCRLLMGHYEHGTEESWTGEKEEVFWVPLNRKDPVRLLMFFTVSFPFPKEFSIMYNLLCGELCFLIIGICEILVRFEHSEHLVVLLGWKMLLAPGFEKIGVGNWTEI